MSGTILIVEDNAEIRDSLRDIFEGEGYVVLTAENGAVGLQLARCRTPPALVLLDLMMPVMDGWDFLRELRGSGIPALERLPVTVVSGIADHEEAAQLGSLYGCGLLGKPLDIDALLRVALEACGSGA
jgi:CheY-like chemotaxis protein